jgi:hypothetical protein
VVRGDDSEWHPLDAALSGHEVPGDRERTVGIA